MRLQLESQSGESQAWADQVLREGDQAIPVFEEGQDHKNLAMAWRLIAWAHGTRCNYGEAAKAAGRAVDEARVAEDHRQRRRAASQFAVACLYGPMPVAEAIQHCEEIVAEAGGDRRTIGLVTSLMARLYAMRGEFDEARRLYAKARITLEEMGSSVDRELDLARLLRRRDACGQSAAAERELQRDFDTLNAMGERYVLSTVAAELARAIDAQGRHEEALGLTRVAEDLSAEDDITSQALWRVVRERFWHGAASPGRRSPSPRLGSQLLRRTDASVVRDEGLVEVADVMHLCGDPDGAAELLHEALGLLERKGNVAKAATVRSALECSSARRRRHQPAPHELAPSMGRRPVQTAGAMRQIDRRRADDEPA